MGAALLGKADPTWLTANLPALTTLVRDFANPSKADAYFPLARMMDWWEGHSWAGGMQVFGDGKNQESTSESVNGYYAVALLGRALAQAGVAGAADLTRWGQLLMAVEVSGAQHYYQMTEAATAFPVVYPKPFRDNKAVGILWNSKVDYATWVSAVSVGERRPHAGQRLIVFQRDPSPPPCMFTSRLSAPCRYTHAPQFGSTPIYIHAIQYIPFTPASEVLLRREWMVESYPVASFNLSNLAVTPCWKQFGDAALAMLNSTGTATAWSRTLALPYTAADGSPNFFGGYVMCGMQGRCGAGRVAGRWSDRVCAELVSVRGIHETLPIICVPLPMQLQMGFTPQDSPAVLDCQPGGRTHDFAAASAAHGPSAAKPVACAAKPVACAAKPGAFARAA